MISQSASRSTTFLTWKTPPPFWPSTLSFLNTVKPFGKISELAILSFTRTHSRITSGLCWSMNYSRDLTKDFLSLFMLKSSITEYTYLSKTLLKTWLLYRRFKWNLKAEATKTLQFHFLSSPVSLLPSHGTSSPGGCQFKQTFGLRRA